MSFHLFVLNIFFDIMSGIVALLVSYYAFRYNRLIENETLKYISFGFMLLGIGLVAETSVESLVIFNIGDIYTRELLAIGTVSIYDFLEITAYFVFAFGYIRSAFSTAPVREVVGTTAVAGFVPLILQQPASRLIDLFLRTRYLSMISAIISIVFLSMVVFQGTLIYAQSRNRLTLLVLLSFGLILISNGITLGSSLLISVDWYLLSTAVQFAGFLSLLLFLLWRSKIGSTGEASK